MALRLCCSKCLKIILRACCDSFYVGIIFFLANYTQQPSRRQHLFNDELRWHGNILTIYNMCLLCPTPVQNNSLIPDSHFFPEEELLCFLSGGIFAVNFKAFTMNCDALMMNVQNVTDYHFKCAECNVSVNHILWVALPWPIVQSDSR